MREIGDLPRAVGLDDPGPELDPYLDALARCYQRYGVRRTTVPDVARELGVSRSTVYRRAGSVERLGRILLAREVRRALRGLRTPPAPTPEALVEILAALVSFAADHGVLRKLARDEPDLVGAALVGEYRRILGAAVPLLALALRRAMRRGLVARRDPAAVAEWLVRLTVSLVVTPPLGDARVLLREVLLPVLSPRVAAD